MSHHQREHYLVKCECKNCGWTGRARILQQALLSQAACPRCENRAVLRKRVIIAPWRYIDVPKDAWTT